MFSSKTALLIRSAVQSRVLANGLHSTSALNAKVAVVLSGCGVYDGSEIHEASATLVHLSRNKADVDIFAPDIEQMHVVNHIKGEPMEPNRNVLVESARIARGKIAALSALKASGFDAVIFPGGFGAAKNLSTFAVDGTAMKVNPEVERVLKEFHGAKKPIGLCCIAPVLAAKVFPGCEVTVGSDPDTAGAIEAMDSTHVKKNVTECHVDSSNKIVTTPAFMCDADLYKIFDGVGLMVKQVLSLVK
ncbi:Glutamine amidotransferase-like class 1 domain-containing protein 3, mitochondrial [Nucella lapillus]